MTKNKQARTKSIVAAAIAATFVLSPLAANVSYAAAGFTDLQQTGKYESAIVELAKQNVVSGYKNRFQPNNTVNRAEFAKMVSLGLDLDLSKGQGVTLTDVTKKDWFYSYATGLVGNGAIAADKGAFSPKASITQELLVKTVAALLQVDAAELQAMLGENYAADKNATRAETAYIIYQAMQLNKSIHAEVTNVKVLNAITLEVTFSAPLTKADVDLTQAKQNFVFDNGMAILNVPQLKTGAKATYIVPTTPHQAGKDYTLTYKGKKAATFTGSDVKIPLRSAAQTTNDTIQVESRLEDGVTDYGNVIQAYAGTRGGLEFALDDNNMYNGKKYEILSSMRDKKVTVTPEGGEPIIASYVPFTQATDGRQTPKFRLPAGQTLKPGVKYTVTSEWATIANPTFTAKEIAPLVIQSVDAVSETTVTVTLAQDPQDELFGGRSITLTAQDGTKLTAAYKVTTRKGATGSFELTNGGKLTSGATYTVEPVGGWATAQQVTVTGK